MIQIVKQDIYRSTPEIDAYPDRIRVTLDMHRWKWREVVKALNKQGIEIVRKESK